MSIDRTCNMSDLNRVRRELERDMSAVRSAADKAQKNALALESSLKENAKKIKQIARSVDAVADDVADQRRQIHDMGREVAHLEAQQQADQRLIQQNQKLIAAVQQDVQQLDQNVAANRQAIQQANQHIQVLEREADLARQRISANERHIQQLDQGVKQINDYLEAERQAREAERRAKLQDLDAQERLASQLQSQFEPARMRFFGAYHEFMQAVAILDQARQNRQKGNLEAAIAQYEQGQVTLMKIGREVDEREKLFVDKRAQCEATINQLLSEFELLADSDMNKWYAPEFAQLQKRLNALREAFGGRQYEYAGEPVEVRQALEQMNLQAMQIYQDARLLETKLLETIGQHETRKARLRDIMRVLRRVWDADFPYRVSQLNEEDPKSTIKLQTERPSAPNATVYLDLDGTVQFSWTGYEGMACMDDVDQFEQMMREEQQVIIELVGESVSIPSNPNPPFGGPGGIKVPSPQIQDATQEKVRQNR
jgi:chromosome segregation ATPase